MADDALDKKLYFEHWNLTEGDPDAEEQWERKLAMHRGVRFMASPMIFVSQDVCYDSPIDGRPITSMAAHRDDLARSGCVAYDPEMKKDAARRRQESADKLESSIDDHVEREWAGMPSQKKEVLAAEMQAGVTLEPVRQTLGA